jgi:NAD(P)-dependent dehydrogenase (short-subunit alcohol dehydrogenase family)
MTSLNIDENSFPSQEGKVALVTGMMCSSICSIMPYLNIFSGGSSGIGLATTKILCGKGAKVHILDRNPPPVDTLSPNILYHHCDISSWTLLRSKFEDIGRIDYVFANAGVTESTNYFSENFDGDGKLEEPTYDVLSVNLRATLNVIKLAWSSMKKFGVEGSIVVTTSATAYAPEQSLPVYSGGKLAVSSSYFPNICHYRLKPRYLRFTARWSNSGSPLSDHQRQYNP